MTNVCETSLLLVCIQVQTNITVSGVMQSISVDFDAWRVFFFPYHVNLVELWHKLGKDTGVIVF